MSEKSHTSVFQFRANFIGIVKLSVVNKRIISVGHRLRAVFGVYYNKSPVNKHGAVALKHSVGVGTSRR